MNNLTSAGSVIVFFLLFLGSKSTAQTFTQIPGITNKTNFTAVNESANIAVVGGYSFYKSTDQGVNWTQMNSSLGSALYSFEGFNVAIVDQLTMSIVGKAFDYSTCSVARTTDGGSTWNTTLSVPSTSNTTELTDIAVHGNTMIVTGVNGIYRSTDAGTTWTFIPVSSGGQVGKFVRYNQAADSWLIGGYSTNFHLSTDNGLTWTETNLSISSGSVLGATSYTNGILLNSSLLNTKVIRMDDNNSEQAVVSFPNNLVMNSNACKTSGFLPDNRLLTHNDQLFYVVDTATANVYYLTSPTYSSYIPKHFSLGSTYGVACANTFGGLQGRVYRIDLTQTGTVQIHPYFQIAGPGPCAGDNIVATANADYADSVRWYVNNVYINTGTSMTYPTPPGVYTTYAVKLIQYFNGASQTTIKNVVMTAPHAPQTFSYVVDTTACYGEQLLVTITPNGPAVPNSMLKITYNGQLVYGPISMSLSNINAYTTPISTNGLLKIITYKSDYCDPSTDTAAVNITVGPNLFDLNILPHDSVICAGVYPYLYIDGTNSNYSYDFYSTYSFASGESGHTTVPGNSNGTIEAYQYGTESYLNDDTQPQTYGTLYMYVNLEITDDAGCSPTSVIDTIRIQRSKAFYELYSRSFLQNDTVHLSNAYVTPNRLWSSDELDQSFLLNETDTIPLIIADTIGFFGIKLKNEPLPGCADSMLNYIHYTTPAPEMDTACATIKLHRNDFPHRVKMDQFGNLYEIRVYEEDTYNAPLYVLSKYDPFGNLLWQNKATNTGWSYGGITGIVIEEVDFDDEGNPVIALWIQGEDGYQDDYIDFPNFWPGEGAACYVLKLDQLTGDYIWRTNLSNILNLSTDTRITDVVVDGDKVHASVFSNSIIFFSTLNGDDGAFIHSDFINFGWSNTPFISEGYHLPIGSTGGGRHSYWSPQLDVLSTGEVVAVGNYNNVSNLNYPQLQMSPGVTVGTFIMKYHPDLGIYDVQNVATTAQNGTVMPTMFVDKNDHITIAGNWTHDVFYTPIPPLTKILDSVIQMPFGTFVLNMDKDYTMNWLALGTNSAVQDMTYSRATNHTYLASYTKDNFSIGNDDTHMMAGYERQYDLTYTHVPYYFSPMLESYSNAHFITHLDEYGKPVEMKVIQQFDTVNYAYPDMKLAASACGDLAIFWGNAGFYPDYNGPTYQGDSLYLFLQYADCSELLCSYIEVPDTLECFTGNSVDLQLSDYFNLDSFTYDIVQNNNVIVSNQTATVTNGHFNIPVSAIAPPFQIICTSPNIDTLFVGSPLIVQFGTLTIDTVCVYDGVVSLTGGSPAGGTYSGAGVSGSMFTPSTAGLGTHVLTYTYNNQGCEGSDVAEAFVDECLGIDENEISISIYPNPFMNDFQVVCNGIVNGELALLDQTGRTVYRSVLSDGATNVKTSALSSGNYTVVIMDETQHIYRYKLVKM